MYVCDFLYKFIKMYAIPFVCVCVFVCVCLCVCVCVYKYIKVCATHIYILIISYRFGIYIFSMYIDI